MAKTPKKKTSKAQDVIQEPATAPVTPEVPDEGPFAPSDVEPEASPDPDDLDDFDPEPPAAVTAVSASTPEGAEPDDRPKFHFIPKPTFILLPDGRYREEKWEHDRAITIDGIRYEHVAEDADGRWIYARS